MFFKAFLSPITTGVQINTIAAHLIAVEVEISPIISVTAGVPVASVISRAYTKYSMVYTPKVFVKFPIARLAATAMAWPAFTFRSSLPSAL